MDTCEFSESQLKRYRANLAGLRDSQPKLAERLEGLQIPPTVQRATGRDGCHTFRMGRDDGSWQWFGHSSMPSVSTPALLGGYRSKGRNVIFSGMGTTHEVLFVERRSPPHCAVLVHEPDLLALKLALHLQDFSALIGRARLVLVGGKDLVEALAETFARQPGLEFPQELLPIPGASAAKLERARSLLGAAGERIARGQAEAAGELARDLGRRREFSLPGSPRVAVLSRDPRGATIELAASIRDTLNRMGWPAECCVPDRPDQCHSVARLKLIHRHQPDMVLLLNCLEGPLAGYLPRRQPTCSWLTTADSVQAAAPHGLEHDRLIFAAHGAVVERLTAAGAGPGRVHLLERATDPAVYAPIEVDGDGPAESACQVAVLADGYDLRASAANITLTSHARQWEAVYKRVQRAIGRWRDASAERLLEQGERDGGARLSDADLRDRFLQLVRRRLVPTLAARLVIERLADEGLKVAVWGAGWDTHGGVKPLSRELPAGPAAKNAIYNSAEVVVCPWWEERTVQTVLDCLAAGGCPAFLMPEERLDKEHPQLHGVLRATPRASSPEELPGVVRRLVGNREARRAATEKARQAVLDKHTLASRLETIRAKVLEVYAPASGR